MVCTVIRNRSCVPPYNINYGEGLVAAIVIRVQRCGSADRASRHDDEAVKESGSTPQSLQDSKEIIDMVGTQNEKIKAI